MRGLDKAAACLQVVTEIKAQTKGGWRRGSTSPPPSTTCWTLPLAQRHGDREQPGPRDRLARPAFARHIRCGRSATASTAVSHEMSDAAVRRGQGSDIGMDILEAASPEQVSGPANASHGLTATPTRRRSTTILKLASPAVGETPRQPLPTRSPAGTTWTSSLATKCCWVAPCVFVPSLWRPAPSASWTLLVPKDSTCSPCRGDPCDLSNER